MEQIDTKSSTSVHNNETFTNNKQSLQIREQNKPKTNKHKSATNVHKKRTIGKNKKIEDVEVLPAVRDDTPLNVEMLTIMLNKQYSQADIARAFNVSDQAVSQFIQRHKAKIQRLINFDEAMAAKWLSLTDEITQSVDPDIIKKASLRDRIISAATAQDKARDLQGKTQAPFNINILAGQVELYDQIQAELARRSGSNQAVVNPLLDVPD